MRSALVRGPRLLLWAAMAALLLVPADEIAARTHRRHRSSRRAPSGAPDKRPPVRAPAQPPSPPTQPPPEIEPPPAPLEIEPEPAPLEIEPPPAPLTVQPLPPSGGSGDTVEIIDLSPASAPASAPPATRSAPPSPDSFSLTGWARARASVGLPSTAAAADDTTAVPHDRLVTQGQLHLRLRYARGRRFEAVVSGLLSAALYEQDARPPDTFNLFNGDVRTSYEAILREAQIGIFLPRFDLRIGQQRIPWGRGDAFTPNDVVNAYDLRDQFLTETEVQRIPTLALRGDLSLGPLVLSAVLAPIYQPNRFDSYGGNWSLFQPDAPETYRKLANQVRSQLAIDPTLYPMLQPLLQQTALPPGNLTGTAAGLRVSLGLHRVDLDAYYHYGYDPTPQLRLSDAFVQNLAIATQSSDSSTAFALLLSGLGDDSVSATYVRRHHIGFSVAAPLGPLLLRGDFAADTQTVLPARDLQGVVLPTVQGVLGIEYQRGELGKALALEAQYMHVVDYPSDRSLLFARQHNAALAGLARWTFFRDHLQLELRALVGIVPFSYAVRPQVALLFRGVAIRFGALLPGGEDSSFGNYYRRNQSVYTMVRYSF